MTHLVFWYGVKFEDRGQGFSFVPDGKIVPYDEGEQKGYNKIPKKIQTKLDKNQKLTKTEEQIKNGLKQIVSDMALEKVDRIKWMMNFKEDYELAAEAAEQAAKAALEKAAKTKRKPGSPKKEDSVDKPKRGPGRPKKVVDGEDPHNHDDEFARDYDQKSQESGATGVNANLNLLHEQESALQRTISRKLVGAMKEASSASDCSQHDSSDDDLDDLGVDLR